MSESHKYLHFTGRTWDIYVGTQTVGIRLNSYMLFCCTWSYLNDFLQYVLKAYVPQHSIQDVSYHSIVHYIQRQRNNAVEPLYTLGP